MWRFRATDSRCGYYGNSAISLIDFSFAFGPSVGWYWMTTSFPASCMTESPKDVWNVFSTWLLNVAPNTRVSSNQLWKSEQSYLCPCQVCFPDFAHQFLVSTCRYVDLNVCKVFKRHIHAHTMLNTDTNTHLCCFSNSSGTRVYAEEGSLDNECVDVHLDKRENYSTHQYPVCIHCTWKKGFFHFYCTPVWLNESIMATRPLLLLLTP